VTLQQDEGVAVRKLGQNPRLAELLRGLVAIRLAQNGRPCRVFGNLPNPVRAPLLQQERQLANVLRDSIQAGIQRRVAGQVAALQLVVLLPRARIGFMDDAPATTPVSHGLRRLRARDVEPKDSHLSPRLPDRAACISALTCPCEAKSPPLPVHRPQDHAPGKRGSQGCDGSEPRPRCPAPRAAYRWRGIEFALVTSPEKGGAGFPAPPCA